MRTRNAAQMIDGDTEVTAVVTIRRDRLEAGQ